MLNHCYSWIRRGLKRMESNSEDAKEINPSIGSKISILGIILSILIGLKYLPIIGILIFGLIYAPLLLLSGAGLFIALGIVICFLMMPVFIYFGLSIASFILSLKIRKAGNRIRRGSDLKKNTRIVRIASLFALILSIISAILIIFYTINIYMKYHEFVPGLISFIIIVDIPIIIISIMLLVTVSYVVTSGESDDLDDYMNDIKKGSNKDQYGFSSLKSDREELKNLRKYGRRKI